jgi:sensor histidine kinase YesM
MKTLRSALVLILMFLWFSFVGLWFLSLTLRPELNPWNILLFLAHIYLVQVYGRSAIRTMRLKEKQNEN